MNLHSLDHVHFSVPDLDRAQSILRPWVPGEFTPVYGSEELNAFGVWNMSGLDLIQVLDASEPAFGGARIEGLGMLSISFRVDDIDVGIREAEAAGLRLRSRVGSEDIGMGKNVVQAQFHPSESFDLGLELVERQIPGDPHEPLDRESIDYFEHTVPELDGPISFLTNFLGAPFHPVVEEDEIGARSVRHTRFGLKLIAPTRQDGVVGQRLERQGPGLHALAFQSREFERDQAIAKELGLDLVRLAESAPGVREAEFASEFETILRLVERMPA